VPFNFNVIDQLDQFQLTALALILIACWPILSYGEEVEYCVEGDGEIQGVKGKFGPAKQSLLLVYF
jgi:hypothetical protein